MGRSGKTLAPRLMVERAIAGDLAAATAPKPASGAQARAKGAALPARSVTVNLADSPLGWLYAHGHVCRRQFEAGERLRADYERAQLSARVTMRWDAAPISGGRGGSAPTPDLAGTQLDARRRFDRAIRVAGPGLSDILWRVVCAGDGMRQAEGALGWPARAGKLVLAFALDRLANHYRIR